MKNKKIHEGDSDLVTEMMAAVVKQAAYLIEGKFVNRFEIKFLVDDKEFELILKPVDQ